MLCLQHNILLQKTEKNLRSIGVTLAHRGDHLLLVVGADRERSRRTGSSREKEGSEVEEGDAVMREEGLLLLGPPLPRLRREGGREGGRKGGREGRSEREEGREGGSERKGGREGGRE